MPAELFYENVEDNDRLPNFDITVNRTHIARYAGASGDFYPVHVDEEFCKSIGLPSVFAMGQMHGGMLSRVVTDWAGAGRVKKYKLRFKGVVWPNDTLTFKGNAVKKYQDNGENLVDCHLFVVNQNNQNVIEGEATVSLPLHKE